MRHFWKVWLFVALIGAAGCAHKQDTTNANAAAEKAEPADLDAVSPEQLAAAPCGNPDWSKLPPKSAKSK